ncbi:hypothetical protein Ddye_029284 [Dipteronia dyeriana]|uniref:Reverse transcriptase zinc-binding domain-containing protein n=1 Tax=Dipteronia dyeriana TaxID=168575 RepID=A0AAD9TEA3_9ROSI|nr:hypothetical protein Ddye_029284 [Dipteronia dyeriana]
MGKLWEKWCLLGGCSLSPYLFIICDEVLPNLIKRAEDNGHGLGIRCCRGTPLVSHLFFTDDSILFCTSVKLPYIMGWKLKRCWRFMRGDLGSVSTSKSLVLLLAQMWMLKPELVPKFVWFTEYSSHDKYRGLPTMVGRNKRRTFNVIKEKLWSKSRSWKGNLFSAGGKEVFIKVVAQAMPIYVMSVFQIPGNRNVPVNPICTCCKLEEETLEHTIFWCIEVSAIWKKTAL